MGNMTNNGTAVDTRSRVLSWIALGVVYLVWGSTYLAIRVGVGHLPPLLFAGTRYVIASALLYPIALRATTSSRGSAQDRAKPGARAWLAGAVIGILLLFAGNGGLTIGETTLPSGLAAVLVATVPLWMIVFAWPVQHQRVTFRSAVGLAVGLAGGAVLLAVGAGSGEFSRVQWSSVPATSWIALAYLIGPGSILAFTAYGYALSHLPVTTVSTYAYVNPVVAVLAGIMFLGEQFTRREGLGAALVLASVIITLHRSRSTSRPAPVRDSEMPEARCSRSTQRHPAGASGAPPASTDIPAFPLRSQADNLCYYRLHKCAKLHSQVTPPWSQAVVWSRSHRAAGRPHPGAVHRVLRAWMRCWSLRLGWYPVSACRWPQRPRAIGVS